MSNLNKYKVQFNKRYLKDLQKIPRADQRQIRESILSLADNPRPSGCKKLKGSKGFLYRVRWGDYRVVYTIQDDVLIVLVIAVGHRRDVYRYK
ncbi:type II toxin-antitoxin system RelE/ParE family toxin [Simkania negevensis]|uniref:Type II toxin-antitoxin system RelE/ParE family toxin n=1 Tax=Simkania negevensis TaxID=83561 RepID=A0ABS3AQP7_9BACT|nr:type II toxin-antitoxin system RelE/ParE family toxin [Simkania negevensis]